MNMNNSKSLLVLGVLILASFAIQSSAIAQQKNDPKFNKMMKDGFRAEGIAGLDRIDQDATQKFCSDPVFANSKQGDAMRDKIQKMNMASIQQPSDGKYIGDWKKGRLSLKVVVVLPGLIRRALQLEAGVITAIRSIRRKFLMERLDPLYGITVSFVAIPLK